MSSGARAAGAVVCLCGLPGAGKSTLARHVLAVGAERLRAALRVQGLRLWHLCFDDALAALQKEAGASDFDPELWHRARELALHAVHALFLFRSGTKALEAIARSSMAGNAEAASCIDIVLLDDNMHYRSMRRAYYKVAREAQLAFCTICLPLPVVEAVARDARRSPPHHVGRATIEVMAEALQWPDPDRFPWEGTAIRLEHWQVSEPAADVLSTIRGTVTEREDGGASSQMLAAAPSTAQPLDVLPPPAPLPALPSLPPAPPAPLAPALDTLDASAVAPARSEISISVWEIDFWEALASAVASPVEAEPTTGIEAAARAVLASASAAVTAESAVHQFDLRLRRHVTAQMKAHEGLALGPPQRTAFAKLVAERKKEALQTCKRRLAELAVAEDADADRVMDAIEQQFAMGLRVAS
jgi:tRNA uridine 5-carbamoylmethylation protein Kti12|eukprot:jgi/Chrpa1/22957/Chrysochromulina_OHIO_Genome00008267-RA